MKYAVQIAPALGLFLLAPLIGEFLLGNISIDAAPYALLLAPMYGGGALLIREVARRNGRGWPTIALLGVAYSLIEEGLADQMIFNPAYDAQHMLDKAYIPAWGTGAWVILASVSVHAIWSICVSIGMMEALAPQRATTPWLGRVGMTVIALVFAAGVVYVTYGNYQEYHFLASPTQLTVTTAVIVAIVVTAFAIRPGPREPTAAAVPSPWWVGVLSLAASSVIMVVILDYFSPWLAVASWFALVIGFVAMVLHWSRSRIWDARHRLALAGGSLLTYVWIGFPAEPVAGSKGTVDLIGNIVFATAALAVLAGAIRQVRRAQRT